MQASARVEQARRVATLCRLIQLGLQSYDESRDPMIVDDLIFRVDLLLQHLSCSPLGDRAADNDQVASMEMVALSLAALSSIRDRHEQMSGYTLSTNNSGRGRPRFQFSQDQLEHLLGIDFSCPAIANMLGVSVRTVRRHMSEYGLTVRANYSNISNSDLDDLVSDLKQQYPTCGYRMMDGLLRQRGIRLQQLRVRESMQRTDPNGVVIRLADLIQRRKYHVHGPLSLWHIDGNHKLIR